MVVLLYRIFHLQLFWNLRLKSINLDNLETGYYRRASVKRDWFPADLLVAQTFENKFWAQNFSQNYFLLQEFSAQWNQSLSFGISLFSSTFWIWINVLIFIFVSFLVFESSRQIGPWTFCLFFKCGQMSLWQLVPKKVSSKTRSKSPKIFDQIVQIQTNILNV